MAIPRFRSLLRCRKWDKRDWLGFVFIVFILSFFFDSTSYSVKLMLWSQAKETGARTLTHPFHLDGSLPSHHFQLEMHGYKRCTEKEKKALLELKKYMLSTSIQETINYVLPTWTNDTNSDCCLWEGVQCDPISERIIELSFGGPYLKENSLLNLSLLHPLEEVRSLDLSHSNFSDIFDDVEGYKSLGRLRNLEILNLSVNYFNDSIFRFLNAATSLTTLFLNFNNMNGPLHVKKLRDLKNLELLNLSSNKFNGSIPIQELTSFKKLKALSLSYNEFSMGLQGVCELENIEELDLSQNKLVGQFPSCLTSFTRLRVLDLSSNNLTGKLPDALGNLEYLEYLSLFDNNFEGIFSVGSITNLSRLKVFKLGSTSNSLELESGKSWKPRFQLSVVSLKTCKLEKVPQFLIYQQNLRHVDLSDNNISEEFPYWLLENNTKLEVLLLPNNLFRSFQLPEFDHNLLCLDVSVNKFDQFLPENIGWRLPRIVYMNLANNGFQGNMPSSLSNLKNLQFMDISHNSFQGELPRSFLEGCNSLNILKLSHNRLSGKAFLGSANLSSIFALSMDNNQFTGMIGQGWQSLESLGMLDISHNNLTGVIPNWIGELPRIYALLLSNNSLEGEIPVSLFKLSDLQIIDLSANLLSGSIPSHVSSIYPKVLLLQDNNLSGAIPNTLLANVTALDLRNNRLSGNIPKFINTQNINILLLRGNNLTGRIPHELCDLSNIQILDLSNNKLDGSIPSCINEASFGFETEDTFDRFYDAIFSSGAKFDIYFKSLIVQDEYSKDYEAGIRTEFEFATKHRYDTYWGRNLKLLFGIDLSNNELSGNIPVEFGGLLKLQALNLSHNNLSGMIPESLSNLRNVESFDLSFNRLQGHIPPTLLDLNNLAVFNVSYNNISGMIPHGKQFNTFDMLSYLGNSFLCGQPSNRSCKDDIFQEPDGEVEVDESTIDMVSFYWSFAAAYFTILLVILASLYFVSPWRRAWFYIVDAFIDKLRNLI